MSKLASVPNVMTQKMVYVYHGFADKKFVDAYGECAPTSGVGPPAECKTFAYNLVTLKSGKLSYWWVIGFVVPPHDPTVTYTQEVYCIDAEGNKVKQQGYKMLDLKTKGIKDAAQQAPARRTRPVATIKGNLDRPPDSPKADVATIAALQAGNNIPADGFEPYGDLLTNPMGVVSLSTIPPGTTYVPDTITSDYTTYFFWIAYFGSVPSGPYTLYAADNQGQGQTVGPLNAS
jgi:hypothetical protein